MGSIKDINVTGLEKGKISANLGDAHEHVVAGILIRLGFDVGIVDVHGTPFDLLIIGSKDPKGEKVTLRAQVKTTTASNQITFTGGGRAGKDRTYKSGVKTYKYGTTHSDLILGIDRDTFDVYVLPTKFISSWGKSRTVSKLQSLKNNWDILLNWNDSYLDALEKQL